jgi:hypothetical protein
MQDFNSDQHVEEWMAENGGVDGLRRALARGAFGGQNKSLSAAWLLMYDQKQAEVKAEKESSLLERSVLAAEQSARSAQQSARWAIWASIVAFVAIVVGVLQSCSNSAR